MFVVVDFAAGGKCTSTSSICIMAGEAVTTNGKQSILMLRTSHISKKVWQLKTKNKNKNNFVCVGVVFLQMKCNAAFQIELYLIFFSKLPCFSV